MDEAKIEKILVPVNATENQSREKTVREKFWPKFRQFAARIPFADELLAAYFCAIDANTPTRVRAVLMASLVYFIMPLDVIPDILAFVGMGDDIAVLTTAFAMVKNHITDAHREAAQRALRDDEQKV